jgi:hypothetical protein
MEITPKQSIRRATSQFFTFRVPGGTPGGVMKLCHLAPKHRGRANRPLWMLSAEPLTAAPPTVS